ncbi:MAG: DUF5989 family protein [Mucilaginibacter sp.]
MELIIEFFHFLGARKKIWLIPLVIFLVLLGIFLVVAQSSALAPFIYSLF